MAISNEEKLNNLKEQMKKTSPTVKKSGSDIVADSVETDLNMHRSYAEWRKELAWQCGVYVFGEQYLAKRFYQINYKFCSQDQAKEIATDNVYTLLRHKYFKKINDAVDDKIRDIVKNFTMNLASTLKRVSLDKDDDCEVVRRIPDYCVAFKNGVYDFLNDRFLFKYEIDYVEDLSNRIYSYDTSYIIQWYLNFDFEPLPFGISDTSLEEFVNLMNEVESEYKYCGMDSEDYKNKNICFELMYNMAHDSANKFDMEKFKHLCEVIGYNMNVSFVQAFVILIGTGRNGKNSLFDGCFSAKVVPMPTQNSMVTIETDKFIGGTLENKFHNIYLETDEKSVSLGSSATLKLLTGSEFQTAEHKGADRISTLINCKYTFSANEQEKLKFGDISDGFKRRINMYEVFYQFVPNIDKLKKRSLSYYYTPFKQDLSNVTCNLENFRTFVYLAMYGIKIATKNFTRGFEFTKTDWNDAYSDLDLDLRDKVNAITLPRILKYMKSNAAKYRECQKMFYDTGEKNQDAKPVQLFKSKSFEEFGFNNTYDDMYKMLQDNEKYLDYFAEYDIYMNIADIQALTNDSAIPLATYTANFKRLFPECKVQRLNNNKNYVLINFNNDKLTIRTRR